MTVVEHAARPAAATGHAGPLLHVEQLSVTFRRDGRDLRAVRDLTMSVAAGSTRVVVGESGSGKSVTLGALLGTLGTRARIGGSVVFAGRELLGLTDRELRSVQGSGIGYVPQLPQDAFNPLRRIGRQLEESLRVHDVVGSRREARDRAEHLLRLVGIPDPSDVARNYPHELSGGMCQRAAIALAISAEPALLLADEPTTALDVSVQAQILELLVTLQAQRAMSLIMVTHDVGVAEQMGGEVTVMYAGRVVEEGVTGRVVVAAGHPYTQGLLDSRPSPEQRRGELTPIPGQPPSLLDVSPGCSFAPRCARVEPGCTTSRPELTMVPSGSRIACPPRVRELSRA